MENPGEVARKQASAKRAEALKMLAEADAELAKLQQEMNEVPVGKREAKRAKKEDVVEVEAKPARRGRSGR
jgi:hypothetical protein